MQGITGYGYATVKVITVVNPKGGSGKTTLVTNMACFLCRAGLDVTIFDADSQLSALDWIKGRDASLPIIRVSAVKPGQLTERIRFAQADDRPASVLLIDLPARFPIEQQLQLNELSDVVLIPTLASPVDVRAMVRYVFSLYSHNYTLENAPDTAVIANRVRARTLMHDELIDFLEHIRFPMIGELRDTQNYLHAIGNGKGIAELPKRRVIKDLLQWKPIIEWLHDRLFPEQQFDSEALFGERCGNRGQL